MTNIQHPPIKQRVFRVGMRIGQKGRVLMGSLSSSELLLVHALALYWEDADVRIVIPRTVRQFAHSEIGERQIGLQGLDIGRRNLRAVFGEQLLEDSDPGSRHTLANI